jgi:hypothetical protein
MAAGDRASAAERKRELTPYTDALNLLESAGYTRFRGFNTFGDSFEAMVTRRGKPLMVMIEPRRRRIVLLQ